MSSHGIIRYSGVNFVNETEMETEVHEKTSRNQQLKYTKRKYSKS